MSSRNLPIHDKEIERGRSRSGDSSSSRESSPTNKRKRDLTPPSDNESVVPAAVVDDTPPPPQRPLVREPVAFSKSVTANINTYQASLPPALNAQKYLPGQNPSKGKKKRNKQVPPFSAQTGRFRVESYEHNTGTQATPSPPLQRGPGPYNSLYRAGDDVTLPIVDVQSCAGPSNIQALDSSSRPQSKRAKLTTAQHNVASILDENLLTMPEPILDTLQVDAYYSNDFPPPGSSRPWPASTDDQSQPDSSARSRSYLPSSQTQLSSLSTNNERNRDPGKTDNIRRSPPAKRPGFHNRMITILIHDTRSGKVDRQLAEVTIPVKMADDPQDGFWADAKDITERLQSSPSRIDGPARIYTLRGKYRQFFLRVSANNVDNFASANIGISADRTLDVVVEKPPEVGFMPPPPRIPSELLPSSPEVVDTSDLSDETRKGEKKKRKARRKSKTFSTERRQNSSPDDDSSDISLDTHDKQKGTSQKTYRRQTSKGTVAMSALDYLPSLKNRRDSIGIRTFRQTSFEQMRGFDSPSTDEEPGQLYEMIVRAVEVVIQRQPDGPSYSRWRAGCASELIKAYGFIQRMMDELVGELAPFRTKTHEIRKCHVLAALRIEPKMASECTETLKLLKLYGENGTRGCDRRVLELITRNDPKPYKQLKMVLRLLRNIHEEWKQRHGASQSDTMEDGGE